MTSQDIFMTNNNLILSAISLLFYLDIFISYYIIIIYLYYILYIFIYKKSLNTNFYSYTSLIFFDYSTKRPVVAVTPFIV